MVFSVRNAPPGARVEAIITLDEQKHPVGPWRAAFPWQLRWGIAVLIIAAVLFALIAEEVAREGPLVLLDERCAHWLHQHRTPTLTALMLFVTRMHVPAMIDLFALLFAIYLGSRREWVGVAIVAVVIPAGLLFNTLLKHVFARGRPAFDDSLMTLNSYSFPSGHTAGATLLYGLLALYWVPRLKGRGARTAMLAAAAGMVAWVGFSRLYLGVHYLSDVLAAICASTAWLALWLTAAHALARHHTAPRG